MPEEEGLKLKVHVARYDEENYEIVSNLKVQTKQYPSGAWLCTKLYLVMSVGMHSTWDTLVRFMAYGGDGCVLNNIFPIIALCEYLLVFMEL